MLLEVSQVFRFRILGVVPQTLVCRTIKRQHGRRAGRLIPLLVPLGVEAVSVVSLIWCHLLCLVFLKTYLARASEIPNKDLICDGECCCIIDSNSDDKNCGCVVAILLRSVYVMLRDLAGDSKNTR